MSLTAKVIPVENYSVGSDGWVFTDRQCQFGLLLHPNSQARANGRFRAKFLDDAGRKWYANDYRVVGYPQSMAVDTDGDGIDDMTEYASFSGMNPLNAAPSIEDEDAAITFLISSPR